jgi:hypothetical protein
MDDGAGASSASAAAGSGGAAMDIRDMKEANLTAAQKMSLKMSEAKRGRSRTPKRAVQVGGADAGLEAAQAAAAGKGVTADPEKLKKQTRSKTPLRKDEQWSYRNVKAKKHAENQAFMSQRAMNRNARVRPLFRRSFPSACLSCSRCGLCWHRSARPIAIRPLPSPSTCTPAKRVWAHATVVRGLSAPLVCDAKRLPIFSPSVSAVACELPSAALRPARRNTCVTPFRLLQFVQPAYLLSPSALLLLEAAIASVGGWQYHREVAKRILLNYFQVGGGGGRWAAARAFAAFTLTTESSCNNKW